MKNWNGFLNVTGKSNFFKKVYIFRFLFKAILVTLMTYQVWQGYAQVLYFLDAVDVQISRISSKITPAGAKFQFWEIARIFTLTLTLYFSKRLSRSFLEFFLHQPLMAQQSGPISTVPTRSIRSSWMMTPGGFGSWTSPSPIQSILTRNLSTAADRCTRNTIKPRTSI